MTYIFNENNRWITQTVTFVYFVSEWTQGHEINIISPALICVRFPVDKVSFLFKVKSWRTPTLTFYNHPAICQFSNFGVQSDTKIISVNTCSGKIGMYESIYIAIFFSFFRSISNHTDKKVLILNKIFIFGNHCVKYGHKQMKRRLK